MRRKTRTSRRQVVLFPAAAQGGRVPTQAQHELVLALADLLLEALKVQTRVEGGRDDEHEDHA